MESKQMWCMTYACVMAMRLHPKNDEPHGVDVKDAARIAEEAADIATSAMEDLWRSDGERR